VEEPAEVVTNGRELSITGAAIAAVTETAQEESGMEYKLVGDDVTSLPSPASDFSNDLQAF
jgi:hypothetical protein